MIASGYAGSARSRQIRGAVLGQGLRAGVDDDLAGHGGADDGRRDVKGEAVGGDRPSADLLAVAEEVRPGADLVHPAGRGFDHRRASSPALTIGTSMPTAARASAAAQRRGSRPPRRRARSRARVAVAGVAEDAFDDQAEVRRGARPTSAAVPGATPVRRLPGSISTRTRSGRPSRRPPRPAVPRRPPSRARPPGRRVMERPQPGRLRPDRPDRVGQEQVVRPAATNISASPSVPTVRPAAPDLELEPAEGHALVGLDVRPEARRRGRRAPPGAAVRSPRRHRGRG